jgi:formamidopyrimidine-DNA glycosylase
MGFKDPRRLSRLRLVNGDPLKVEPISKLGFDPVLGLPEFDYFKKRVLCRAVPVKALLLDQSFSAGVGNWVADEILYQAMIHPAQYTNTMTDEEVRLLYDKMKYVCETAVQVEADEEKFPNDWLMKYRWNKGKNNKERLPNGLLLQFETVNRLYKRLLCVCVCVFSCYIELDLLYRLVEELLLLPQIDKN